MNTSRTILSFLILAALLAPLAAQQAEKPPEKPEAAPSVFDIPSRGELRPRVVERQKLVELEAKMKEAFAAKKWAEAETACRETLELVPHSFEVEYNLACALARQGKADPAMAMLKQAYDDGFTDAAHIASDEDLASLTGRDDFKALVAAATAAGKTVATGLVAQVPPPEKIEPAKPDKADKGEVIVGEKNTLWDARARVFRSYFDLTRPAEPPAICDGLGEAGDLLRQWWKEGTAAGNLGDFYDNHDTEHSNMDYGRFPQLTRIEFSDRAKARGWHHGLQAMFFYNGVVLGNSSTALVNGPIWRSQPRLALTNPRSAAILAAQYFGNHIYFYPEHRDHDPGHNGAGDGYGDVYPMNTPYVVISQGSSGSDVVFMNAVAAALAAFRPEAKEKLRASGMLMPAVQMILRASSKKVKKPEDYLTGVAHPTVFEGGDLDVVRMVKMAHEITADSLPPVARIRVVEEDQPVLGRDYFDIAPREKLLDTPAAIARAAKSTQYWRRMVVTAADSTDPQGGMLKYHWVVLRGDPQRITIKPQNEAGSVAEIRIGYHERRPIAEGSKLESNRVDIGLFVENAKWHSAPAFVTCYFLDNERRVYDEKQRIKVCDYADPEISKNYVDPLVDFPKRWRDEYEYDDAGKLRGWTRLRGDARESFDAEGGLIVDRDDAGAPKAARPVRYIANPRPNETPLLEQE